MHVWHKKSNKSYFIIFIEKPIGTAVCADALVKAGSSKVFEFCLTWDMPKVYFYYKQKSYDRYTSLTITFFDYLLLQSFLFVVEISIPLKYNIKNLNEIFAI